METKDFESGDVVMVITDRFSTLGEICIVLSSRITSFIHCYSTQRNISAFPFRADEIELLERP